MVEAVNDHRNHSVKLDTDLFNLSVKIAIKRTIKHTIKQIPVRHEGQRHYIATRLRTTHKLAAHSEKIRRIICRCRRAGRDAKVGPLPCGSPSTSAKTGHMIR